MTLVTAALHSNNSKHRTILSPLAAREAVVAASGASSNSAMAISVIPANAATIVTTGDADAISADVADSARRTDPAVVEAVVVVAAAADKSRHLVHRSLP